MPGTADVIVTVQVERRRCTRVATRRRADEAADAARNKARSRGPGRQRRAGGNRRHPDRQHVVRPGRVGRSRRRDLDERIHPALGRVVAGRPGAAGSHVRRRRGRPRQRPRSPAETDIRGRVHRRCPGHTRGDRRPCSSTSSQHSGSYTSANRRSCRRRPHPPGSQSQFRQPTSSPAGTAVTVIVNTWFVPTRFVAVGGEIRMYASTQFLTASLHVGPVQPWSMFPCVDVVTGQRPRRRREADIRRRVHRRGARHGRGDRHRAGRRRRQHSGSYTSASRRSCRRCPATRLAVAVPAASVVPAGTAVTVIVNTWFVPTGLIAVDGEIWMNASTHVLVASLHVGPAHRDRGWPASRSPASTSPRRGEADVGRRMHRRGARRGRGDRRPCSSTSSQHSGSYTSANRRSCRRCPHPPGSQSPSRQPASSRQEPPSP